MDDRILKFADSRQFIGRIARSGENNTRSLAFDCSAALAEYPTAQIIAVIQRPQGDPYTVTPDADGTIIRITLTSYDLEFNGHLQIELRVINGNKILKSAIYTATVDDSILGEADAPGQPVRDVLDRLDVEIKQAQAVVDDIHQKLENGEFNGSDAEVTAANIQSALGYAPVKDVQVAGSSVLVDGVANVPIASATVPGVVSVPTPVDSGIWNDNGSLRISLATDAEISGRFGNRKTIACSNLDYAVKAAMCDGKGAAWTSDEQKAARERMGIDKEYELIETITVMDGEITLIERTIEPNGTNYNFKAVYLHCIVPKAEQNGFLYTYINGNTHAPMPGSISNAWSTLGQAMAECKYGMIEGYAIGARDDGTSGVKTRYITSNNVPRGYKNINALRIRSTVSLPINTVIKIWGVRA